MNNLELERRLKDFPVRVTCVYSPLDREAILKDVLTYGYMAVPLANSLLWAINTPALARTQLETGVQDLYCVGGSFLAGHQAKCVFAGP
jgi:hypothetical protein